MMEEVEYKKCGCHVGQSIVCMLGVMLMLPGVAQALDITVTSTAQDNSPGTLRAAIEQINAEPEGSGPHTIDVNFPAAAEPVIQLVEPLPNIKRQVVVDGRADGGDIGVELDGRMIDEPADGLNFIVPGSEVVGVSVYGFSRNGITLIGSTARGCRVGTSRDGVIKAPNEQVGIFADDDSTVGGPNGTILPCTGDCNLIGPNLRDGVVVAGSNVEVLNNQIGVANDGTTALSHGRYGIRVPVTFGAPITQVTIGSIDSPNVVANVGVSGIELVNAFGSGGVSFGVTISSNIVYNVGQSSARPDGQPITFGSDGVELNDAGDTDEGPNQRLNTPVLTNAGVSVSTCEFTVSGFTRPGTTVEFFVAESRNRPRGGTLRYIGRGVEGSADDSDTTTGTYNTPESGTDTTTRFEFAIALTTPPTGTEMNATATDAMGNTSTISAPIALSAGISDADNDSLLDSAECAIGTDPDNPDTDEDGLTDGEEVPTIGHGLPDTDDDGQINPLDDDDDGDGILTSTELAFGDDTQLDPDADGSLAYLDIDSDNDGVDDATEWAQDGFVILDTDGDGLTNLLDSDTDSDGWCDGQGQDSSQGCVPGEDFNENGMTDGMETDSRMADTDEDGTCDGPMSTGSCAAGPDNCPLTANPEQTDTDGDGIGDACSCGDGFVTGNESCDDGNTAAGDGCSATCEVEPGYTCDASEPSVCTCSENCGIVCYSDEDDDGYTGTPHAIPANESCSDHQSNGEAWVPNDDGDCDDTDFAINPEALEYCDGQDNDCDELIGAMDPDIREANPAAVGGMTLYADLDEDTCGDPSNQITACSANEPGASENADDVDDTDGKCCGNDKLDPGEICDDRYIGNAECPEGTAGRPVCNNDTSQNPDYDGTCTFSEPPVGCVEVIVCYSDEDGDGAVGTQQQILAPGVCSGFQSGPAETPWGTTSEDCLDDPGMICATSVYPGSVEICDGCDNDCDTTTTDGSADSEVGQSCDGDDEDSCAFGEQICVDGGVVCDEQGAEPEWFADNDGDGCGDMGVPYSGCPAEGEVPEGYVDNAIDGDDGDGVCCPIEEYQGDEVCDSIGVDEDCDQAVNEEDPDVMRDPALAGAVAYYRDADGDGCGIADDAVVLCEGEPDPGYVRSDSDDDDTDGVCCNDPLQAHLEACQEDENSDKPPSGDELVVGGGACTQTGSPTQGLAWLGLLISMLVLCRRYSVIPTRGL